MIISYKYINYSLKQIKKLSFFINKIKMLPMLILLQGSYYDCTGTASEEGSILKMSQEKFDKKLNEIDDVSDWKNKKGRSFLYHAVKNKKSEKVKMILKRYHKQEISGLAHKKQDFMNTPDLTTGHTPLGESIIQGNM